MGVIYLISILVLSIGFILIKKSDKKLNIISFISITIVLTLCYNAFLCYILTFIKIPTTLINLSIINIILAGILFFIIFRKKEIQKYEIDKIRNNLYLNNSSFSPSSDIFELWYTI